MKPFVGLFIALVILSTPTSAQEKNEVGLNIGATLTPSESLAPGGSLIGPSGNVLPNRSLNFDSSLALGAEYDHRIVPGSRVAFYAGMDFLASPNDVQLSQRTQNAPKSYAYIFLTPHVRARFNPRGRLSPWLEFGGGVDTHTLFHAFTIPIGVRLEVRDFYSGLPNYNVKVTGSLQNNVAFTAGLLIKF